MACMGPNQEEAYKDADKAFEEIFALLQSKYHISDPDHVYDTVRGLDGVTRKTKPIVGFGFFNKDCKKSKVKLQKTLRELFWNDACNSF